MVGENKRKEGVTKLTQQLAAIESRKRIGTTRAHKLTHIHK